MFVGVFVIDDEQAVLGRAVDRNEADEVVVVAELARLRFRRLVRRVEVRGIGEESVAPAQKHVGVIAFGHVMVGIDARGDFLEVEARRTRLRMRLVGRHQRQRRHGRGDRRRSQRALQEPTTREATGDDLAHGRVRGGIEALALGFLQKTGLEMGAHRRLVVHRLTSFERIRPTPGRHERRRWDGL